MTRWLLFSASLLLVHSFTFSQTNQITIQFDNTNLEDALDRLSELSGFLFSYNPDNFPGQSKITAHFTGQSLDVILGKVLKPLHLEYRIMQNMVVVTVQDPPAEQTSAVEPVGAKLPEKDMPSDAVLQLRDSVVIVYDTMSVVKTIYDTIRSFVTEKYYDTVRVTRTVNQYRQKTGNFSVALAAGLAFPVFQQKENPDDTGTSYVPDSKPAANLGVRFQYEKQKLGLAAGLEYTDVSFSMERKMDSMYTYYEVDTTGSYYVIVDGERQYIYIVDSTAHSVNVPFTGKNTARVQSLSIPVRLTYRIDLNKKISLWAGGEGAVSIFITRPAAGLKATPFFGYAALVQAGYKLAYNSVFYIESRYKGMLEPFTNDFVFKTGFVHATMGLRFFF